MDTAALDLAARRLDEAAELLRARAARIGFGAATTGWRSTAARSYRARAEDVAAEVRRAAAEIAALSDQVRTHALRVRHS